LTESKEIIMTQDSGGPLISPSYASEHLARMKKIAKEKKAPESEEHLEPASDQSGDSSCGVPEDLNDSS
jgi:hypothetical protein